MIWTAKMETLLFRHGPNHFICTSGRNIMQRKPLRHIINQPLRGRTKTHSLIPRPHHHSSLVKGGLVTLVHFLGLTFCFCRNSCRANQIAEWLDILHNINHSLFVAMWQLHLHVLAIIGSTVPRFRNATVPRLVLKSF